MGGRDADDSIRHFLLDPAIAGQPDAARLEAALAAANDALFEVDLAAQTIRWSRGITLLFGHDPERRGGRVASWRPLMHPEDAEGVLADGRAVLASGTRVWSREFRLARADGTYAPVRVRAFVIADAAGRPTHIVGALSDLSAMHALEQELRALGEQLNDELERERTERARAELLMRAATAEVLVEWRLAEDEVMWGPNVEDVLGYPASALASMAEIARRAPHIQRDIEEMREIVASGGSAWSRRLAWSLPSGDEVLLEAHAYVMRDPSGSPERIIASVRRVARPEVAPPSGPVPALTPRQRDVLELVRAGRTNKAIAAELGIGEQAAKTHVRNLMRKFGAPNRAALAAARYLGVLVALAVPII